MSSSHFCFVFGNGSCTELDDVLEIHQQMLSYNTKGIFTETIIKQYLSRYFNNIDDLKLQWTGLAFRSFNSLIPIFCLQGQGRNVNFVFFLWTYNYLYISNLDVQLCLGPKE